MPSEGCQSEDEYDDHYSDSDTDKQSCSSMGPGTEDYYASEELLSEGDSLPLIDYGRLKHQLRAFLGPRASPDDLHSVALSYVNVAIQLKGGAPLTSDELAGDVPITYPFGLTNAVAIVEQLIAMESPVDPVSGEFVGAVESIYDLLEEGGEILSSYSSAGLVEYADVSSPPPPRECFVCDRREGTPDRAVRDLDKNGNEIIPDNDRGRTPPSANLDALLARQGELDDAQR